jgi:hypothetical protein
MGEVHPSPGGSAKCSKQGIIFRVPARYQQDREDADQHKSSSIPIEHSHQYNHSDHPEQMKDRPGQA